MGVQPGGAVHTVRTTRGSRPVRALRSPASMAFGMFGVMMETVIAVFLGGGLGAVARHFVNTGVMQIWHRDFPLGILVINILGSFLMGVLISTFAHVWDTPQNVRAFLTVGILGGFTTFSSFSLDTIMLFERGQYIQAAIYLFASVGISLLALILGMWLVRMGVKL